MGVAAFSRNLLVMNACAAIRSLGFSTTRIATDDVTTMPFAWRWRLAVPVHAGPPAAPPLDVAIASDAALGAAGRRGVAGHRDVMAAACSGAAIFVRRRDRTAGGWTVTIANDYPRPVPSWADRRPRREIAFHCLRVESGP